MENALDEIIAATKLGIPRQMLESKIKSLRLDKHSLQNAPSRLGAEAIHLHGPALGWIETLTKFHQE